MKIRFKAFIYFELQETLKYFELETLRIRYQLHRRQIGGPSNEPCSNELCILNMK